MRRNSWLIPVALIVLALGACRSRIESISPTLVSPSARADLVDSQGQPAGTVTLEQTPAGVLVTVRITRLPPGPHGFHVHETGVCTGPGFESAGAHFDPASRQHGFRSEAGPHGGDLPNLYVGADGTAQAEIMTSAISLRAGARALLDADGSALVIHRFADDHRTHPSGESGDRIACGVLRAG